MAQQYLPSKVYDYAAFLGKAIVLQAFAIKSYSLGRKFYCKALSGESTHNICINSDLTVSCNCSDIDGSGRIGNLGTNSLREVFDGQVAMRFRERLAKGRLAIPRCLKCPELIRIERKDAALRVEQYGLPKCIMVENTVLCNLRCLWCCRNRITSTRQEKVMMLEGIERVAIELRDCEVEELSYFNLGEPFLSAQIDEELRIIRAYLPEVRITTSTNGVFVDSEKKREAALLMDRVYFSIDGASQEKVVIYQVGADFAKSIANMGQLVRSRNAKGQKIPTIEWKYVVFAWNDAKEDIETAIDLAQELGVDAISFWYGDGPTRFKSKLFHSADHFIGLPRIRRNMYRKEISK